MKTFSAKTVLGKTFKTLEFEGKWQQLIGKPEYNFSGIVYGAPKSGKSTFCLQFAGYLTAFGKVLYNATEEGISQSLQERIDRNMAHVIKPEKLFFCRCLDMTEFKKMIKSTKPRFVIIDSAQSMNMTVRQLHELKEFKPKRTIIVVLQSKRNGDFLGAQAWVHDTDIRISLHNGTAKQVGRFQQEGTMQVLENARITARNGTLFPNYQ